MTKDSNRKRDDLSAGLRRALQFLRDDVWDIELGSLSGLRRLGVKLDRIVLLVFRGFREDECPLHASALTFSTLMAIVPLLALSLGFARGLGGAETAKDKIRAAVYDWTRTFSSAEAVPGTKSPAAGPEAPAGDASAPEETTGTSELAAQINSLVDQAFERVDKISFAALSGVGLVILIWMVVEVLGRVEEAFNRVWGVLRHRSLWRRFTDYLSILVVLPVLAVAASSLPIVDFATRFLDEAAAQRLESFLVSGALKTMTVMVMTCLSFTFVIMFMPNTRVRLLPGLAGGIVTAALFILWLRLCAAIQVGAVRYGKIYGSFAIVPILMAWVYISWQIVLFGAEVAFAVQNCTTYRMEQGARRASVRARITLALSLVVAAARAMLDKNGRLDVTAYARDKRVPVRLLNDVVEELVKAGYLARISDNKDSFALLKDPESLKASEIVNTVVHSGVAAEEIGPGLAEPGVDRLVDKAVNGMNGTLGSVSIRNLLGSPSTS